METYRIRLQAYWKAHTIFHEDIFDCMGEEKGLR